MASLAIATIQHTSHQAQQQNDGDLSRAKENSKLHTEDDKVPSSEIDDSKKVITLQNADSVTAAPDLEWKAGKEEWMIILVIAVVSLMVALDATILVSVLPVGGFEVTRTRRRQRSNTFRPSPAI